MKKVMIPAIIALALAGALVLQLFGMGSIKCEVCITFEGRRQCAVSRGETTEEARREAQSSACSLIAHGVSDAFACPNHTPDSVTCTPETGKEP